MKSVLYHRALYRFSFEIMIKIVQNRNSEGHFLLLITLQNKYEKPILMRR